MKIAQALFVLALLTGASVSEAMTPPKYLSVPKWQSCVSTITKGTAQYVCLPKHRPQTCPMMSWMKLDHHHMLPHCPKVMMPK